MISANFSENEGNFWRKRKIGQITLQCLPQRLYDLGEAAGKFLIPLATEISCSLDGGSECKIVGDMASPGCMKLGNAQRSF